MPNDPVTTSDTDADFIRRMKYRDVLPHEKTVLKTNERLEKIAQRLEAMDERAN